MLCEKRVAARSKAALELHCTLLDKSFLTFLKGGIVEAGIANIDDIW